MKILLAMIPFVLLSGCADYGVSRYQVEPFLISEKLVCCKVDVANGKEIGRVKLHVQKDGDKITVDLDETAVKAFEGQKVAVEGTKIGLDAAAKVAIVAIAAPLAPALAPVVGAALAAPGAGAAAAGAVGVLGVQKVIQ